MEVIDIHNLVVGDIIKYVGKSSTMELHPLELNKYQVIMGVNKEYGYIKTIFRDRFESDGSRVENTFCFGSTYYSCCIKCDGQFKYDNGVPLNWDELCED
jgi:hypothetical protein